MSGACPRLGFTLRLPPGESPQEALDPLGLEAIAARDAWVVTRVGSQTTESDRLAVASRWPSADVGPLVDLDA